MRYFLVDFENVSDSGLKGFFSLRNEDQVVLFYTLKANRVSMEFFEAVMTRPHCGSLRFLQVSAGNQALDLQLASYLGSLVAAGESGCEYYIISKDKGFQCLVSFWEKQGRSIRLRQFGSIAEALSQRWPELPSAAQPAPQEKGAQQQSAPQPAPQQAVQQPEKPEPPTEQPEPKQAAQPVPQAEPAPRTAEAAPAPEPEKPEPVKDEPQPEKNQPEVQKVQPEPQKPQPEPEKPQPPTLPVPAPPRALAVQNTEKPEQKPQPNGQNKNQSQKNQPNEKTLLNTRVQQALSKAKYDTAIISHVASLVAKTFGKPKVRQLVYLDLIKEYGQKKGLEIYQLVKTML